MNNATEVDLGLLSWVKGEIDLAIGRAGESLHIYAANPADTAPLKLAINQLHQAHGALAIVGLAGVTQLSDALEQLMEGLDNGKLAFTPAAVDTAQKGLTAILHYLDDLITGSPNQALRLYPVYQEVVCARGQPQPAASDLFFPDLSLRPPKREQAAHNLTQDELNKVLRQQRMAFQRGMLKWLRNNALGLHDMRSALAEIENTENQPSKRALWWIAQGMLDNLIGTDTPASDGLVRKLCARVDTQIRKLIEGSTVVAERLLRDTLYLVATAPTGSSEHLECVRAAYGLGDLMPASAGHDADSEHKRPLLRILRELVGGAKDDWNRFCSGTAAALPPFHERVEALVKQAQAFGQKDFSRLSAALGEVAALLRKDPLRQDESFALEIATGLLLAENALETYPVLGANFPQQVDAVVERLAALVRGEKIDALAVPQLDEISKRAQERLLMGQVVREIAVNLAVIEQALDAFFRDPEKREGLLPLTKPIDQVAGALTILGQDRAVAMLRECEAKIAAFAAPDAPRDGAQYEDVAKKLSAIGFFVEQLRYGPADLDAILDPPKPELLTSTSVGNEIDVTKRLTQTLIGALRENPEDAGLRKELQQNLESLRDDAQLNADAGLEQQATAAIEALLDQNASQPQLEEVIAPLVQAPEEPVLPSPEISRLAEASSEELDAELLGIFLEEAHEVLGTLNLELPRSIEAPHDLEALTTIRRSFHTLKGSGRMVGLNDLGEAAWAVEQVMNAWLQQEADATPVLHEMLGKATDLFGEWVAELSKGNVVTPDTRQLIAQCEQLKRPEEMQAPAPAPAGISEEERLMLEEAAAAEAEQLTTTSEAPTAEPALETDDTLLDFTEPQAENLAEGATVLDFPTPPPVQIGNLSVPASLYELYLGEARTHIDTLQAEFTLDYEPPSEPMLRAAHTLTGISATVGILPVHMLCGALESALLRFVEAKQAIPDEQHDLIARTIGALDGMVGVVANRRMPAEDEELTAALNLLVPVEQIPEYAPLSEVDANPSALPPFGAIVPEVIPLPDAAAPASDLSPQLLLEDEIDEQLLPIFLEESVDLMRDIGAALREWHAHPNDEKIAEQLQRSLHTFKGSARMAGAMNLGELVHNMESRIVQHSGPVSDAFLDSLDAAYDNSAQILDFLRRGEAPPAPRSLAAAPVADASSIEEPAAPQAVVPGSAATAFSDTDTPLPAAGSEEETSIENFLRVRALQVDEMVNSAGEIAIARARIEDELRTIKASLLDLTENVIRLRGQLREIEIQAETQMQSQQTLAAEQNAEFDPLEFDRFTRFQELTRMMAESVNDVSTIQHNLLRNLEHTDAAIAAQSRINRDLSQSLMSVRMVPFNSIVDRLYRVVRQAAKDTNKRANLEILGGQTELDRSVLERMVGPLEHLLRNAIAHGLESVEQRRAQGKSDIGEITLALAQTGNEIQIILSDDGAGLDFDRIRAIGEKRGMLRFGQAVDEEALIRLIFEPGFSTASEITTLAGRGVGMDVVKSETVNLGGRIDAVSKPGQGTTFNIYLPLTLAIAQTVLIRMGNRTYAIPSSMVAQANELTPIVIERVRSEGYTEWMGQVYPYRYLARLLGRPDAQPLPARRHWLLLLRAGNQLLALEVDELLGNREVVVKNIGPQLARVTGIAGATVLGNGEIALILNPIALAIRPVAELAAQQEGEIDTAALSIPTQRMPTVMIVDDSLTVRKITGRLLERSGYKVITTKDGIEALEHLAENIPDVMLVDIEMPRMDGFDLTRSVRADDKLKDIPIVMITSRTADKHRNYAMEIGVNEYLGKPYDEDKLLSLVKKFAEHS